MGHPTSPRELDPQTPAFVIDADALGRFAGRFESALERHWPNSILSYSFKTNSLPWLLAYYRRRGLWAEVVSDSEYELALAVGYPPDQIVFNGPVKSCEQLHDALRAGSIVNLDSQREIEWTVELARNSQGHSFDVGLRINWDLESYCPGESTATGEGSRFGFNVESGAFDGALERLRNAGVSVAGLHMHRNSRTQSIQVFRAAASVAAGLIASRELTLEWLDIGGGFFGSEDGSPTVDEYVSIIREALDPVLDVDRVRLIVEPGGALIAVPVEFHASVIDVKEIGSSVFVVTDASRTNIDPLFRRHRPFDVTVRQTRPASTQSRDEQIICGFTCMEDDRITRLRDAPALAPGDRIVFHKVGAYTMSYQSNFIEFLPAVYVRSADELIQVRRKWRAHDYLQGNVWADDADTAAPEVSARKAAAELREQSAM